MCYDSSPLLVVYGYVARKTMEKADCSSCKAMFGSLEKPFNLDINPEHFFTYFCLMFPSNLFLTLYFVGIAFSICVFQKS